MDMSHGASQIAAAQQSPVLLAKAALRRMALEKTEPTPENYARAYAAEGGHVDKPGLPERARPLLQRLLAAPPIEGAGQAETLLRALMSGRWDDAAAALDGSAAAAGAMAQDWAELLQRLAHGLERGSRLWTTARKKDSLTRVLGSSRSDIALLHERVRHLMEAWENEVEEAGVDSRAAALDEPIVVHAPELPLAPPAAAAAAPPASGSRWSTSSRARCAPRFPRARRARPSCRKR